MSLHTYLPSSALAEIFAQASRSGRITRADHSRLIAALTEGSLSEEEKSSIKRLLYAVRRNRIAVEGVPYFFVSVTDIAS